MTDVEPQVTESVTPQRADTTRLVVVAAVTAVAAAGLSLWVGPFRPGHLLGISGDGVGHLAGGVAWWAGLGIVVGLLARRPALFTAALTGGRAAMADDTDRLAHLAIGGAVGLLVIAVTVPAIAIITIVALLAVLSPALAAKWSSGVTVLLVGLAGGAVLGAALPRTAERITAAVVAVLVVAWLLWRRSQSGPKEAAVAVLLLTVLVVAATSVMRVRVASADDRSAEVTVDGDRAFVPTDVTVAAGEVLKISAKGSVSFVNGNEAASSNPDGFPARFSGCGGPGFCGVLVGRIAKGAPFLIGSRYAAPMTVAGKLELGINDFDPSDNDGSFDATISVLPASAAATLTQTGSLAPTPATIAGVPGSTPSNAWALMAAAMAALGAILGGVAAPRAARSAAT